MIKICGKEPAGPVRKNARPTSRPAHKASMNSPKRKDKETFLYCQVFIFLDAELLSVLTTGYEL